MDFRPIATLPGWEATEGGFRLCRCGHLRFLRYLRRTGDTCALAVLTDTPRAAEAAIAALAATLAQVRAEALIGGAA